MENYEFSSKDVLAYVFKKCAELNIHDVSITKAQKLLYCCYGIVLANNGVRLCKEHPACWHYGPVFPSSYRAWKERELDYSNKTIKTIDSDEELSDVLKSTLEYFGKASASQLVAWSHLPNSPWSLSSYNGEFLYGDIDDSLTIDCFNKFIKK